MKQIPKAAAHIGRPSLFGPKDTRPGITVTREANDKARRDARAMGCSISDCWEAAMRAFRPASVRR